jgi:hypothetical protein
MLRIRFLIVLALGFLACSAAWADEVGYVDCSNHSDATQVFGKPRRTPDTVASIPCGERFTILVYGFYFSRIQTKDGQIGYIYSSLIAVDRGATVAQQTPSLQSAAEKTKIPSTKSTDARVNPAPAQPQPAARQQAPATPAGFPTPASVSSASSSPAAAADTSTSPAPAASTILPEAPAASAAPATAVPTTAAETAPATAVQPDQPAATQPAQPAVAQPAAPTTPEITLSASASNPPEVSAPAAQPDAAPVAAQPDAAPAAAPDPAPAQPAAQPQPAPIKPAPASIRPADTRDSWEKPNPSVRTPPLIEFFGGFAYARMSGGSGYSSTGFNGALGSFGYNFKSWLQLVADTSYNFETVSGTKTILYGNHYGPRYFFRRPNRFHITPFAEGLIGGSRADVTPSGGPTTSQNSITYKLGGGIDYRPSRRWEIRIVDFDYYRTAFGTNAHQNNYWASTGIVLRLFGGSE